MSAVLYRGSNEICLLRVLLKSEHSTRMCLTVSGHWQVVHSGWSAPDLTTLCIYPILSLLMTTSSRRDRDDLIWFLRQETSAITFTGHMAAYIYRYSPELNSVDLPIDLGLHAGTCVQEANTWLGSAEATSGGGLSWLRTDHCWKGDRPAEEAPLGLLRG